ncbi:MAG TPA: hypothetical protein VE972_04105 [Conexibacter sp.]|nr:hypothetical protein [Conexibacter sp.]
MQSLSVDLVLLRSAAPDLPLAVGRVLAARVIERNGKHGILNLAGALLTAELPDEVQVGDRLRLIVRETTAERVVLQLAGHARAAALAQPPPAEVPHAPDRRIAVLAREEDTPPGDGRPAKVVMLRVETPTLGTVELRIALDDELVHARAALVEGVPLTLARAHAGALKSAIGAAAGRAAEVDVVARPDPLDVYA